MARKTEPKPYHHGDLKNGLIEAGLRVLAEHGVAGMNLREVARVAGVSHTAPYRHFADKQALITAIADDGFDKLAAAIRSVDAADFDTATARLAAAGAAYVGFGCDNPDHFLLMFNRASASVERTSFESVAKVGFEFMVRRIQEGQRKGELRAGDALDMAKLLWSAMHGLAMLLIENQLPLPETAPKKRREAIAQLAESHVRMIMAGLRA